MHRGPRRLAMRWGRGDELAVAGVGGGGEPRTYTIKTKSWDETPEEMRTLVSAGHKAFRELGQVGQDIVAIREVSGRLHRSLSSSWKRLAARIAHENQFTDQASRAALQDYAEKLRLSAAAWHCAEILCLQEGEVCSADLVRWVYEHYLREVEPYERAAEELDARVRGSESPHFWKVIFASVLRGDLLKAWGLVKHDRRYIHAAHQVHSEQQLDSDDARNGPAVYYLFQDVGKLMLMMPRQADFSLDTAQTLEFSEEDIELWQQSDLSGATSREFGSRWIAWRDSLTRFAEEHENVIEGLNCGELRSLLDMLRGKEDALVKPLKGPRDGWQHVLAAVLLFKAPLQRKQDLFPIVQELMNHELEMLSKDKQANQVVIETRKRENQVLERCFALDMTGLLQSIHQVVGDRWVEAHLAQVLAQAGAVESAMLAERHGQASRGGTTQQLSLLTPQDFVLPGIEMDLREALVAGYATQLGLGGRQSSRNAHSPAAWRLAADYFVSLSREVSIPTLSFGPVGQRVGVVKLPLGLAYMELVMDRQRPASDKHCMELVQGCRSLMLEDQVGVSLLRQRTMHWWCFRGGRAKFSHNKQISASFLRAPSFHGVANALVWAQRAGPAELSRVLRAVFELNDVRTLDLLVEHLGSSPTILTDNRWADAQPASFLSTYSSMHQSLVSASQALAASQQRVGLTDDDAASLEETAWIQRDSAAQQLVQMIETGSTPKPIHLALLRKVLLWERDCDAVRRNPPCLLLRQATLLQGCLEDVLFLSDSASVSATPTEVSVMRVMLSQAVAHAAIAGAY